MNAKIQLRTRLQALRAALGGWLAGSHSTGLNPLDRWRILRPVAVTLIISMLSLAVSPLANALQASNELARRNAVAPADLYSRLLERYATPATATPLSSSERQALAQAGEAIRAELQAQLDAFRNAGVASAILQQQDTLLADFDRRHRSLLAAIDKGDASLIAAQLDKPAAPPAGSAQALPGVAASKWTQLPWRVEQGKARKPLTDAASLQQLLGVADGQNAARGSAKDTPSAADLAETLDAQLTPAIRAKAAELGNNPHRIYQWVHDNIHFFPSYGSAQGAQDTLDKLSGNAFDTASLLIALLRAAKIPARYVYGTIEVPTDKVMNWVGDARTVDAAQQILSQGGIPNIALVSGGKIVSVRMEHLWVEAFIDYHPARGAKHTGGVSQGDSWIPLDGSYKQYTYQNGMDLQGSVPLDTQAFLDAAKQGATVNEAEGWVQNLNQANIQSQLVAYQSRLKAAIDSGKPNATVGDVLGTRKAEIDKLPYLAGSAPYRIKLVAQRLSELPNSLRHQFRYRLFDDDYGRQIDNSLLDYQAPTASLAGKKITLAWAPASAADQKAIESLLPKPHADGSPILPSELPGGLSSAIQVKLQIRVDGETKAEGPSMRIGSEPVGAGAFTRYSDLADWDETTDLLVAGQQSALGLSIQGIGKVQLETLKARLEQTKGKLEAAQANPGQAATLLGGMTGEHITGDLLTANIWSYFASLQSHGATTSAQAQMIDRPGLGYGLFHAVAQPRKLYGIITTGVSFKGVMMDVGHLRHMRWVKDDNPAAAINSAPQLTANGRSAAQNRWIAYNRMRGQHASAMEHSIPEQFFIDRTQCRFTDNSVNPPVIRNPAMTDCAQGISAVKAIALAQSQGQKIFTITQANAAQAIPKLQHRRSVIDEVSSAVAAGKEVTIHEKAISESGWTGAGYTVIDPETGAGGYLIEGGARGAILIILGVIVLALGILALDGLIVLGPLGAAIFLDILMLGGALITAGIALIAGSTAGCLFAMSVASTALWNLIRTTGWFGYLLSNALSGPFNALFGSAALSICS